MTRSSKVAAAAIVTVLALLLYPRPAPRPHPETASATPAVEKLPGSGIVAQGGTGAPSNVIAGGSGSWLPNPETGAPTNPSQALPVLTLRPTGQIGNPATFWKPGYQPTPRVVVSKGTGGTLRGSATWYAWHPGEAAAGPGLRAWLGADWRGKVVTVIAPGCTCAPIVVRLTDWCLCRDDRIVDLDRASFAALADPDRGIIPVLILEGDWTQ